MPRDDIEELRKELSLAESRFDYIFEEKEKMEYDCHVLARKLLEAKPELEEWVKLNFGEYL